MDSQSGFTRMTPDEFTGWIAQQSVSRTVNHLQQHHTWIPNYSHFDGTNHFARQSAMRNSHINDRGFSDIGQHFSIFPDGMVLTGRPLNKSPACISGHNSGGICIENVGDFDIGKGQMRPEQEAAILKVSAAILKRFSTITPDDAHVVYHHWFATKSCPGTGFFGGNDKAAFNANFLPKLKAAMGLAPAGPAPAPTPVDLPGVLRYAFVSATALNVRQGPSSQNAKITEHGPVEYGAILRVYAEQDGWLKVSNSKQHWVYGRFTDPATPAVVTVADSNVRSGPGAAFNVQDVLQPGAQVFVIATEGEWRKIGDFRWLHRSLIA
jgi:SH3-like domain-containing protein